MSLIKIFALLVAYLPTYLYAATEIPANFVAVAQYTGVPEKILFAVAASESQRIGYGGIKPWPWTLNIGGEAHYFENRQTMFEALMKALQNGRTNIDIGPMQANWYWKFEQMTSPWIITDPDYNIKLGGQILAGHYRRHGDWWTAVGKYHRESDEPEHKAAAEAYAARVKKIWRRL